MQIKLMYKIHCLNVAQGLSRSANNDTFYETYEQALEQARSYVDHDRSSDSMVIYKAHVLVRPAQAPVEVLTITNKGITVPFLKSFLTGRQAE
ncbi:hypothetical protein LCGC14_2301770 [marine sediment metagenome]|uniref:Uncharacterized protein n=1 Tax=marine sediment metagenome TaxID=412755 RepID=A0A0F9CNB6_9ZZZZ